MIALLVVLTPIALIYGLVILPSGLASLAAAMASDKPYITSGAYILGKFVPKIVFGLLVAIGLDAIFDQITAQATDIWRNPSAPAVALQLAIGVVLVFASYRFSRTWQESTKKKSTSLTPVAAFTLGAGLTILSLPGNLLYFAAIDQILRAELPLPGIVFAVLYYNLVLLTPLTLIVVSRWLFGARADPFFTAVDRFLERHGKRILAVGMLILGVVLIADGIGWFLGFPVLPSYIR